MTKVRLRIKKILFLDILTDDIILRKKIYRTVYGGKTYSEVMRRGFGVRRSQWAHVDASLGKFPAALSQYSAVVLGGSFADPVAGHEKSWMFPVYRVIRKIAEQKIPMLGICGGLQFAVRAFGGTVVFNPRGRELGSIRVTLNRAGKNDRLFYGLPKKLTVPSSHQCMARMVKKSWTLLGSSRMCHVQALAIGDRIRLLQFHPEMGHRQLKTIAALRKPMLLREGFVKNDADFRKFLGSIRNTENVGKRVLKNFIHYFVLPRRAP